MHSSTETFSRRIIGKTDNAHRVYYETINVRYTLVQSSVDRMKNLIKNRAEKSYNSESLIRIATQPVSVTR